MIDSIRISLISQQRIVMLRDIDGERQLPIWIGPCEAESIAVELQDTEVARPLTHDLLKLAVNALGGKVSHIEVTELKDAVYYAKLYIDQNGEMKEIDCRPSDAIALAVRVKARIFISEEVMAQAAIQPEPDISEPEEGAEEAGGDAPVELDAFKDFVDTLDFDEED
ncbi:MAG TPA: bifunctional nuclease family protein [Anaerolineae bacterium]|nr:bifunctional nuclease family protein [Anaerolineae bacterium]